MQSWESTGLTGHEHISNTSAVDGCHVSFVVAFAGAGCRPAARLTACVCQWGVFHGHGFASRTTSRRKPFRLNAKSRGFCPRRQRRPLSSVPQAGHGGSDGRDPGMIDAPGLVHTDTFIEIPEHTLLAWHRDQRPRDDRAAKLLVH